MKKQNKLAEIIKPFGDYKTPGPNENVIKILRETLEEAEHGEIVAVAIAAINSGGFISVRCQKGSRGMAEIIGAVAVLQHDILESWETIIDDAG